MKILHDRVAVIIGGGGGIGRELAIQLLKQGCHLALVDINQQALEQTVNHLPSNNKKVTTHVINITDKQQVSELPEVIANQHGNINLLINSAGITLQKSFAKHSIQDWEKIVNLNWWGTLYTCHYFLEELKKADNAHIVNISSMTGLVGLPNQSSYCATKSAVKTFSEALWTELRHVNIGVTCVCPGAVQTEMMKATLQQSDDVATATKNYKLAQKVGVSAPHAAKKIIIAIKKNKMRVRIGWDSLLFDLLKRLFPQWFHYLFTKVKVIF